jgi:hypothetical protein
MNMPLQAMQFQTDTVPDRREHEQPVERMIGKVISVNGARATISTSATSIQGVNTDFWRAPAASSAWCLKWPCATTSGMITSPIF